MQHLNIPLSRHTQTTRPFGRVVWLLAGLLIVSGFFVYRVGALWFNRGTILSLAPHDTVLAVELRLNKKTAPFLLDWLAGVTLLSDRSLELADLAPYLHGDLAIFVTKNGERSVAIRSSKASLPSNLLSQLSIVAQEQGSMILLSSTLVPISGMTSFPSPILPSIGKTWLGRVVMPEDGLWGNLFLSATNLALELKTDKQTARKSQYIQEAAVALSELSWEEQWPILQGLQRILSEGSLILEHVGGIDIAVVPVETGLETLLKIDAPKATSEDLIKELEKIGALARPTISSQILQDGSKLQEILVQPELTSVEEIYTDIGTSYRVSVGGGSYILAALRDGTALFSNSQALLEGSARETYKIGETSCSKISNRVSPSFLVEQASLDYLRPQLALFNEIFDDFSAISFEFKKYSTIVSLCRI